MSETSTETSTESNAQEAHPTAQEAARAYEGTSDDRTNGSVADDNAPSSTPRDDTGPSGTIALPDSSVPSEISIFPDRWGAWIHDSTPSGTETPPDISVPSRTEILPNSLAPGAIAAPPIARGGELDPGYPPPSKETSPPGTFPAPRMNLQNNLRLRMKVWTDPSTLKRYLMPMGFMRDLMRGQPVSDVMYAYAMSDGDTKIVELNAVEWNALPFFYFREDGHAPRAVARPMDILP